MDRLVHVIESDKGYLSDLESYTDNIMDAVTFVSYDFAINRLATVSGKLTENCWVGCAYMPFPRPKPFTL
jgi:hypothetical protein